MLLEAGWFEGAEVERGFLFFDKIRNQLAGDGGEGEAHHGVAGGDDDIVTIGCFSEVGKAVRRAGAEANPGFEACEFIRSELGVEGAEGFDDALEAGLADGGVFSTDFHGAGDAELVAHGGDGDAAFF